MITFQKQQMRLSTRERIRKLTELIKDGIELEFSAGLILCYKEQLREQKQILKKENGF